MYGLSPSVDLSFFVGRTIEQISIGCCDFILRLDQDVAVTVTSTVGVVSPAGRRDVYEDYGHAASAAAAVSGQAVTAAEGNDQGTRSLRFQNGVSLEIYEDRKEFECYVIRHGDQLVVV